MFLSKEEEDMLNGEYGEAIRIAMRILTGLGDLYNAEKMIPISSAHLVDSSYQIACGAGLEILEKLVGLDAKVKVPTTLDPAAIDFERWTEFKIPEDFARKQIKLDEYLVKIGATPTYSCTPYFHVNVPRFGEQLAWSESNAVAYVNSVIGARTNRYMAYGDIFAAIAGRVPEFGLHLDENRRGTVVVEIKEDVGRLTDADYPVLGFFLGAELGNEVSVLSNIPKDLTTDQLKALGAAGAAAGSLAMYHVVDVTPEARTLEEATHHDKPKDRIEFDKKAMKDTRERMSTVSGGKIDLVATGCPHASIHQVRMLVELMHDKRVKPNVEFWLCMSRFTKRLAKKMGYTDALQARGVKILTDTCCNNAPLDAWGFKTMITDSGKFAYYAPANLKTNVIFASLEECVKAGVRGEI